MSVNFKLYKADDVPEKTTYFGLSYDGFGGVKLIARDEHGTPLSSILLIRSDGTLNKYPNIRDDIGLQLDKEGRIIERS